MSKKYFEGFDLAETRNFLRARIERRQSLLEQRFKKAWEDFEQIAKMIWKTYHPRAIYQWGSLLDRDRFSEISDIDIALSGHISAESFFEMYGKATDITEFPVDIVELEKIHPLHARNIRDRGRLVYGKE